MTTQVIRPIFSVETLEQRKQNHDELIERIMTADCFDVIGGDPRPNKMFFRNLGDAYGVDTVVQSEVSEYVPCNPDVCAASCTGNHYEARFIVRATHRESGAHMDGDGSCIDNEKWPVRRKRLTKGQREFISKLCSEKKLNDETKAQLAKLVSGGRVSDLRAINPQEASELIDFMLGNIPSLDPVLSVRNTRHNVRGTARTRAVNRAISDLVAGGIVSAEEIVRGHEYGDKKKDAQTTPPARNTPPANGRQQNPPAQPTNRKPPQRTPQGAEGARNTQGATAAQSASIQKRQKETIEKLQKAKNISNTVLRDLIRRATNSTKDAVDSLSEFEAGQLIRQLQKPAAA